MRPAVPSSFPRIAIGVWLAWSALACGAPSWGTSATPEQHVEITGARTWLAEPLDARDVRWLLDTFTEDRENATLEWPPPHRRRVVDISLDLTGSMYEHQVSAGTIMSLAEFSLRHLVEDVRKDRMVRPGDVVTLRVFGSRRAGTQAISRDTMTFTVRPQTVLCDVERPSRLKDRLNIKVRDATRPPDGVTTAANRDAIAEAAETIQTWYLPYLAQGARSDDGFRASPLPEHIKRVLSVYQDAATPVHVHFITDGWFQIGPYNFRPNRVRTDPRLVASMQEYIDQHELRPFATQQANISVWVTGLNDGDDDAFRLTQERFLKWYFQPQSVVLAR